ncbi:hypothetical protein BUALT_Bualt04G0146200 [Buddleja alternifolia]|uniref:Non-specific lipid-transfer protein n=1 Tax=Buddleja alternifolia TaxID=168488 RepID=A0AAV6XVT0_9LAMI|nr:hypothetical protein BUALT_Bualt04G0146200 [Buddleja alternifolia]
MKGGVVVIIAVVLAVVALVATPGEAVSCGDIQSSLSPCIAYLTGSGEPSESCCSGVRSLQASLQSQQDRQTACNCMKSAASSYGVQPNNAAALPGKCGVSIGVNINPNVECSQVS